MVDDEPDVAEAVALVLAGESYDVVAAERCEAALEKARQHHPFLALVDLNLQGCDVARLIADLRAETGARIILCTGTEPSEAVVAAPGADDVLTKPFSAEDLLALVRRFEPQPSQPSGEL